MCRSAANATPTGLAGQGARELTEDPHGELAELAGIYRSQGLTETAEQVARELTAHDAYAAHVHAELGIDSAELTNPWHAAGASAASFTVEALLPVLAILLPAAVRIPMTFVVVLLALAGSGRISGRIGHSSRSRAGN